jgi:hypothetical protein
MMYKSGTIVLNPKAAKSSAVLVIETFKPHHSWMIIKPSLESTYKKLIEIAFAILRKMFRFELVNERCFPYLHLPMTNMLGKMR